MVHLHLKVVPGASRDAIAEVIGERLKVRVTTPPESGRANRAVAALLARPLGVPASALRVVRGHRTARKTLEVRGIEADEVRRRLLGAP